MPSPPTGGEVGGGAYCAGFSTLSPFEQPVETNIESPMNTLAESSERLTTCRTLILSPIKPVFVSVNRARQSISQSESRTDCLAPTWEIKEGRPDYKLFESMTSPSAMPAMRWSVYQSAEAGLFVAVAPGRTPRTEPSPNVNCTMPVCLLANWFQPVFRQSAVR